MQADRLARVSPIDLRVNIGHVYTIDRGECLMLTIDRVNLNIIPVGIVGCPGIK